MSKYLELFKGAFDSTVADKMKPENKPYIGYSLTEGKLTYTATQPNNEIWYTTCDGSTIEITEGFNLEMYGANIISNTYENGKGIIKFDKDITSFVSKTFNGFNPGQIVTYTPFIYSQPVKITYISLPNSVTNISTNAFTGCYLAKNNLVCNSLLNAEENNYWEATIIDVEQNDGLLIKNNAVIKCRTNSTNVIIPDYVNSIGDSAFSNCYNLTSITIPDSVVNIDDGAFFGSTRSQLLTITTSYGTYNAGEYDITITYGENITKTFIINQR